VSSCLSLSSTFSEPKQVDAQLDQVDSCGAQRVLTGILDIYEGFSLAWILVAHIDEALLEYEVQEDVLWGSEDREYVQP
jgi:hypothetical protein